MTESLTWWIMLGIEKPTFVAVALWGPSEILRVLRALWLSRGSGMHWRTCEHLRYRIV